MELHFTVSEELQTSRQNGCGTKTQRLGKRVCVLSGTPEVNVSQCKALAETSTWA